MTHTPGPWRWEFNAEHKRLNLVGGRPLYDLTIIDFERWGMNKATMRLRDTTNDGMNLMFKVHERQDWIAPEPGREQPRLTCLRLCRTCLRCMKEKEGHGITQAT